MESCLGRILPAIGLLNILFSASLAFASHSPPKVPTAPDAPPPKLVPAPPPLMDAPIPPEIGGGYQFGSYPSFHIPFDGKLINDASRVAWMSYQLYEDTKKMVDQHPIIGGNQKVQETLHAARLLVQQSHLFYDQVAMGEENLQGEYFAVVYLFSSIGHMLTEGRQIFPAHLVKEWNDADYALMAVDLHFRQGAISVPWGPSRWSASGWSTQWWGSEWWGYASPNWLYGVWRHPGWSWAGGWGFRPGYGWGQHPGHSPEQHPRWDGARGGHGVHQ